MSKQEDIFQSINSGSFQDFGNVSTTVLFWETDAALNITYINTVIKELTGIDNKQFIGAQLSDIFIADTKRTWKELTLAPKGEFGNLIFKVKSENSDFIYANVSGASTVINGEIAGYFGICSIERTNTLAKKVIKRLQRTNKTILSSLSEAIVIVDKNHKFTLVSPNFYNLWGLNKEEFFLLSLKEVLKIMQNCLSKYSLSILPSFSEDLTNPNKAKYTLKFKDGRIIEGTSSPHIVEGKIEGRCWSFKDISKQSYLVDKLSGLAFRDSLTKLYNRRWCEKKLKQLLKRKTKQNKAFLYMDLDHFKVINDSCGHLHGDKALEQISQIFLESFGKKAMLARLGGDEFGLILLDKSEPEVINAANLVKEALANYTYLWKSKMFKVGISIGVVFIDPADDFKTVFVHADEACYLAKNTGKNKYVIYNAEKDEFQKLRPNLNGTMPSKKRCSMASLSCGVNPS